MSDTRLRPPGGQPPPEQATTPDGERIALRPLAEEICRRYRAEFSDEEARYGDAGVAWCIHDNQYILSWAFGDAAGLIDLTAQVSWLAEVLEARDFPRARLSRNLELAAETVEAAVGPDANQVAHRLRDAAAGIA